ncbi:uncharacterized protein [Porites lutea]|uniref:uncharacterized protein n=1 Tax=Porites lutea TaxID=51062 RepID=UPI003CC68049
MLSERLLANVPNLEYLDISSNEISLLPDGAFTKLRSLKYLFLQNNNLSRISNVTFSGNRDLFYVFLSANRLKMIPSGVMFLYNYFIGVIMLSDNPLTAIEPKAIRIPDSGLSLYLLRTNLKTLNPESILGYPAPGSDSSSLLGSFFSTV